jgi:hypothetical protein
LQTSGDAIVPD